MQSLLLIATAIGVGFALLGYAARTPSQTALSNAVIAIGVSAIIFVLLLPTVRRFGGNKTSR